MARKKSANSTNTNNSDVRELQREIAQLRDQVSGIHAQHAEDLELAAQLGYELGLIEAEEAELARAEAIANAVVAFEQAQGRKVSRLSQVPQQVKSQRRSAVAKKPSIQAPMKAGRQRQSRAFEKAAPVQSSISETSAVHVPETGEVEPVATH